MQQQSNTSLLLGIGIVSLGVLLLFEMLNMVQGSTIYEMLWPVMVFATGLGMASSKSTRFFGYVVLWVGFLLLLRQLNVFGSGYGEGLLAFLFALTGLGVVMVLGDRVTIKSSGNLQDKNPKH